MLSGRVGEEGVLLVRTGDRIHAVSASCTHYGAPLADGVLLNGELRCPWHHARFQVATGDVVGPPAMNPLSCYEVIREGDRVRVGGKLSPPKRPSAPGQVPASVVVIGGGPASLFAVETLRREGYEGPITMVSAESGPPVDRPNLSKDYLAGNAPEEWIPLRSPEALAAARIELRGGVSATRIEPRERRVHLSDGSAVAYGALLLATGAEPLRLEIPGAALPHVFTLRTHADSKAIIARAASARRAVIVGASFIGLEVAASLRARGLDVTVVAHDQIPMQRTLGPDVGRFVQGLHEEKGVHFELGRVPTSISSSAVTLDDGREVAADLVVLGVGVRPNVALAEAAGCKVERGVLVNEYLETTVPGIWAAGDVARWPDGRARRSARVEHWVVAAQLGQVAAKNILGKREPFRSVPFFWSQHYDVPVAYVGNGEGWESAEVKGSLQERNALVIYRRAGKIVAVASIYRDRDSLLAEDALERGDDAALERLASSL